MRVIPSNYKKLGLIKQEEKFADLLEALFSDNDLSVIQLESFPHPGSKVFLCLILRKSGVLFVQTITNHSPLTENQILFYEDRLLPSLANPISQKLAHHRQLQVSTGVGKYLKIPIKIMFYCPLLKRSEQASTVNGFLNKHMIFIDDLLAADNDISKFEGLLKNGLQLEEELLTELSDDDVKAVLFQAASEYVIPRYICKEAQPKNINSNIGGSLEKIKLTGEENFVEAWQLDQQQVCLVNDLLDKHQLLLACAGSGKSVVLLSAAIKVAKTNPEYKVLVTFYNRPLSTFYEWRLSVAGVDLRNFKCMNFHQLCRKLLIGNNCELPRQTIFTEAYFTGIINTFKEKLYDGTIQDRFHAIFIDEIQDFEPEWYRLCYDLLENKDDYILCICGDVTQDIKHRIKRGKAPWQGDNLPTFQGRRKKIEKNYRNSKEINEFANAFHDSCLDWAFNKSIELHDDDFLTGISQVKSGIFPHVHRCELAQEINLVVKLLIELKTKHNVPYSDTAILFPCRQFPQLKYYIQNGIEALLRQNRVTFSIVKDSEKDEFPTFYHYATRRGVTLSTMDSVKGLDFTGVIICGLLPFTHPIFLTEEEMLTSMKKVYTASTRAMKHLEIVSVNEPEKDLVTKLLIEAELKTKKKSIN